MPMLEELTPKAALRGVLPNSLVTVVSVQWNGPEALELTYKTPTVKGVVKLFPAKYRLEHKDCSERHLAHDSRAQHG